MAENDIVLVLEGLTESGGGIVEPVVLCVADSDITTSAIEATVISILDPEVVTYDVDVTSGPLGEVP